MVFDGEAFVGGGATVLVDGHHAHVHLVADGVPGSLEAVAPCINSAWQVIAAPIAVGPVAPRPEHDEFQHSTESSVSPTFRANLEAP